MSTHESSGISRRQVLGAGAVGLLLSGCAGGAPDQQSTGSARPTGHRKRGGTFRYAPASFAGTASADPQSINGGYALRFASYDTLTTTNHQNKVELSLAEVCEAEHGDQAIWTVRLRDGIEFHNGKTMTADDVIYSIRRILDPKSPGVAANPLGHIDPQRLKKLDSRTVRLHLKTANSQLSQSFSSPGAAIVPVSYDPDNPIGSGPFKQESFTVGQRWAGSRNANYWRESGPYLDRLEFLGFAEPVARNNALLAGQVDGLDGLQPVQVSQIKARDNLQIIVSPSGAFHVFQMRCDKGAMFEDPRVRMAFKLMVNRPKMIELVWSGYGELGNDIGVWHKFDPAVSPDLPQRKQDLDKAKSLLKAAGKDGMSVKLRTANLTTGSMEMSKVMVQEARKAGVTVTLDVVANESQYYGSKAYQTSQFKVDHDETESLSSLVAFSYSGKGVFNNTGYDNPQVNKLFKQALAASESKYLDLMHEVSEKIWNDGPFIVWGRQNMIDVCSKEFTGAVRDATGQGLNGYRFDEISRA